MKSKHILLAAILTFLILGCSNQEVLEPTPVQAQSFTKGTAEASAQEFGPRHHGPHRLLTALDLTEAQQAQVEEILELHREEMQALRQEGGRPDPEERKAHRDTIEEQIASVLTAEQQAKLEALKAELERNVMPEELIDIHIARLDEKLDLTDAQISEIKSLETWNSLIPDRDGEASQRRGHFKKMRGAFKEHEQAIMEILTPEQQTIFEQMHQERREKLRKRGPRFGR